MKFKCKILFCVAVHSLLSASATQKHKKTTNESMFITNADLDVLKKALMISDLGFVKEQLEQKR